MSYSTLEILNILHDSSEFLFQWGYLPVGCLPLMLSFSEMVIRWGHLSLRSSFSKFIFNWGYLKVRSSYGEVLLQWSPLLVRSSSGEVLFLRGHFLFWSSSGRVLFQFIFWISCFFLLCLCFCMLWSGMSILSWILNNCMFPVCLSCNGCRLCCVIM